MLGSVIRNVTSASNGNNAFFLVKGFPETLGHAVIPHVPEDLTVHTKHTHNINEITVAFS